MSASTKLRSLSAAAEKTETDVVMADAKVVGPAVFKAADVAVGGARNKVRIIFRSQV